MNNVWESYQEHFIFNLSDDDFESSVIKPGTMEGVVEIINEKLIWCDDTKDRTSQEIMSISENRFAEGYITWFVPKDNFEHLDNEVAFERRDYDIPGFSDKEEKDWIRRRNYKYMCLLLHFTNTLEGLDLLRARVWKNVERATITWIDAYGEEQEGSIFFPRGCNTLFWEKYRMKRDELIANEHGPIIEEVMQLINRYKQKSKLEAVKQAIWMLKIPYAARKQLSGLVDEKIAS